MSEQQHQNISFNEKLVKVSILESRLQYAYWKAQEFDNIDDLRKDLKKRFTLF